MLIFVPVVYVAGGETQEEAAHLNIKDSTSSQPPCIMLLSNVSQLNICKYGGVVYLYRVFDMNNTNVMRGDSHMMADTLCLPCMLSAYANSNCVLPLITGW